MAGQTNSDHMDINNNIYNNNSISGIRRNSTTSKIVVLGGWSKELEKSMKELVGVKGGKILRRMQKAVLSHSLNIARSLKDLI